MDLFGGSSSPSKQTPKNANAKWIIDLKFTIISHVYGIVQIKPCQGLDGQISPSPDNNVKKKQHRSTGLLHRAKLIHAFAAEDVFVRGA